MGRREREWRVRIEIEKETINQVCVVRNESCWHYIMKMWKSTFRLVQKWYVRGKFISHFHILCVYVLSKWMLNPLTINTVHEKNETLTTSLVNNRIIKFERERERKIQMQLIIGLLFYIFVIVKVLSADKRHPNEKRESLVMDARRFICVCGAYLLFDCVTTLSGMSETTKYVSFRYFLLEMKWNKKTPNSSNITKTAHYESTLDYYVSRIRNSGGIIIITTFLKVLLFFSSHRSIFDDARGKKIEWIAGSLQYI